jgi:hypothetical protein
MNIENEREMKFKRSEEKRLAALMDHHECRVMNHDLFPCYRCQYVNAQYELQKSMGTLDNPSRCRIRSENLDNKADLYPCCSCPCKCK